MPVQAKVTKSVAKPVHVEVIPTTDIESNDNSNTPQATEVRQPNRPSTISEVIGTPLAITTQVHHTGLSEREQILLDGYKTSRVVRILTIIEIGFVLLFGILVPVFLCVLPFPVAGYIGAKKWSHCLLYTFAVYTALEVVVGIISLFFFFKQPAFFALRIVDIIFNLVVLKFTNSLTAFTRALQPADLNFLQTSQVIKTAEEGLIF